MQGHLLRLADWYSQGETKHAGGKNGPSGRDAAEGVAHNDVSEQEHGAEAEVTAPIVLGSGRHLGVYSFDPTTRSLELAKI